MKTQVSLFLPATFKRHKIFIFEFSGIGLLRLVETV